MIRQVVSGILPLAIVARITAAALPAAEPLENALPNASFEEAADGNPARWKPFSWAGSGEFTYAETGRTGRRSVMISSTKGGDVAWHTTVPVEPHSTYRLSGWIKTENVKRAEGKKPGRGALLNLHNMQGIATPAVTGTQDWTRVEVLFDTGGQDSLQVNCLFGGWGLCTGKAWYDDVRLERVSWEDWKPTITIDAEKRGEPISKYIYGQFIEHLGRCIYGGIWAEMLEDRKFYFPITAKYDPYKKLQNTPFPVVGASPWQIIGPADSVTMIKEDSFVGEHTPRIAKGCGIRQNDLAVVKGKDYSGHVWLKAAEGSVTVQVSLIWGLGKTSGELQTITLKNVPTDYTRYPLEFTAGETTDKASLAVKAINGDCFVGTVSLMPADNVEGMRADTLALLKELNSPVYRWPGGNFVSGYNWRDGVGPRDRRPPRKNPAWTGVEHNDFGIDEFMTFCKLLETEPYIAVNSGLGDVESAREEVEYCNAAADTPGGKLRAQNGHPEPYKVKWWSIGNEMYGGWQLGHMPLEEYVKKHNQFAEAMRAVDPEIKLVAVGATGKWSEGMMQHCADHMDLVSEHFYRGSQPGLAAHVKQMPDSVRAKAEAHRDYRQRFESLKGKDIDIALDEWNYWSGPHLFGELGTRYFLKDALGIAAGLHEYARQSDIMFMANYAQTVNVIGCIKTTKTDAAMAATGLPLMLYRKHFGTVPLAVTAQAPLDVAAALTEDGKQLTVGIVNPTMRELKLPLTLKGIQLTGGGRRFEIIGDDPMAYNEPGKPPAVKIEETPVEKVGEELRVAPCSVTLYVLAVK